MKKNFEHTEQIEKYLEGQMTVEEKNAFELRLQNDPELNSEFQFQTETIEGIKAFRKAELKARLESLNVGTGFSLPGIKIAAIAAITATVGLGIYFYQTEEPLDAEENTELAIKEDSFTSGESFSSTTESQEETASVIQEEPLVDISDSHQLLAQEEETVAEEVAKENKEEKPESAEERNNAPLLERNKADVPSSDEVADLEIENKEDTKHTFHYKFYNSKLYLYGDFKSVPYEIIEYNTLSGKSLYLYYQDQFYYLEANQMEISPLQKVREEKLIEELDSLRISN